MAIKPFRRGRLYWLRGAEGPPERRVKVYEPTGTTEFAKAQALAGRRTKEIWDGILLGPRASVTFADAAQSYIDQRKPRPGDASRIDRLVAHFSGRMLADACKQSAVDAAIAALCRPGAAPGTKLRSVIIPLTAIINHAARRGWCDVPHFERPEQPKGRTTWLTPAQALALIDAASQHLKPLLLFYLCTGARVSEALDLEWADVDLTAGTCIFRETKSGRDRIVRLMPAILVALANLAHREGHVFRKPGRRAVPLGEPYADREREEGGQIKTAFHGARRRAGLPSDVTPHCLRHTWATWFQASTRDPMRLKYEGGWGSLAMVERYAHLMNSAMVSEIAAVWGGQANDGQSPAKKSETA